MLVSARARLWGAVRGSDEGEDGAALACSTLSVVQRDDPSGHLQAIGADDIRLRADSNDDDHLAVRLIRLHHAMRLPDVFEAKDPGRL